MKKYAKQFVIVLGVAAVLLALAAFFRSASGTGELERTLKKDWDLELPGGYVVEYRAATDSDLEEGGLRFYALLYEDSIVLDDWLPWVDSTLPTDYAASGAEAAAEILTSLGIPGGEWPDLEGSGMWYASTEDASEILLFHGEEDLRSYVLESIR